MNAPNPGYSIRIESIYHNQNDIFVHAKISPPNPEMDYASVITEIHDEAIISIKLKNTKVFITGKSWSWTEEDEYIYINNVEEFNKVVEGAIKIKFMRQSEV